MLCKLMNVGRKLLKPGREQLEEDEECVLYVETIFRPLESALLLLPSHSRVRMEREKAKLVELTD